MPKRWYYAKGNQKYGPITAENLKQLADSGQLSPNDLVWREGMPQWTNSASVNGLLSVASNSTKQSIPPISTLDQSYSDTFNMEDGGDFGISSAVKATVTEFKSLDYGFLMPYKKMFSKSLIQKKAVRWVIIFGLFPLILMFMKQEFNWSFEGFAWWIGGYFCLFWATYFYGILRPQGKIWQRGLKWAFFTIVVGLPLLFIAQELPIIKSFYSGTESKSLIYRLAGFILGVGILEESCKALPLIIFALRKKEVLPLKSGVFLGMMSGFGFALAEVVQYSMQYWRGGAAVSALAIAEAVDNSTDLMGRVSGSAFGEQMQQLLPKLTEFSGTILLTQLVRFMTLPLLHACWAGVVGWFIAVASNRQGNPWPIVVVGILFMASLHGLYDVFSDGILGIGFAAISLLVFMGYLLQVQDEQIPVISSGTKSNNSIG